VEAIKDQDPEKAVKLMTGMLNHGAEHLEATIRKKQLEKNIQISGIK